MKILNAKRGSHGEDLEKNGFAKKAVTVSKFIRSHRQKYTLIIIIHIILEFTIVFHRIMS